MTFDENMSTGGIYVHIPFCRAKCDYCSFYSEVPSSDNIIEQYINVLCENIKKESSKFQNHKFNTIYFGGGTPSILSHRYVVKVIETVRKYYNISTTSEITIEMNPGDVTQKKLEQLLEAGINRFSFGIQTLNKTCYSFLGRRGGLVDNNFLNLISSFSDLNFSLDFIVGIPGQNITDIRSEFNQLLSINPKHFSIYMLTLESGTPLNSRYIQNDHDEILQITIFKKIKEILEKNNFKHYEISSFSKVGYESKHNQKYWDLSDYIGFGPGAHSFINSKRFYTESNLLDYLKNGPLIIKEDSSAVDLLKDYIFSGLRTKMGISEERYCNKTNLKFPEILNDALEKFIRSGKLKKYFIDSQCFYSIYEEYFFISDSIILEIINEL